MEWTILVEWEGMKKQDNKESKKGENGKGKDTKRYSKRWGSERIRGRGNCPGSTRGKRLKLSNFEHM